MGATGPVVQLSCFVAYLSVCIPLRVWCFFSEPIATFNLRAMCVRLPEAIALTSVTDIVQFSHVQQSLNILQTVRMSLDMTYG